jgi:LuxR family maltose regulon positive regulatory protein
MSAPILATKLFIPVSRPEQVSRPQLIGQLNSGLHGKLTLISAPAGFGKTTLVTEWLNHLNLDSDDENLGEIKTAWLSLDDHDNDPVRFLTYFITALNRIEAVGVEFGQEALNMLQSPQPLPHETILTALINEIAVINIKMVLVLDDYHLIDTQTIHEALNFLIENQPSQFHLVIATREDPLLSLSRLRVRGQITELRATDLCFSSAEIAKFFNQVMGLGLKAADIAVLETRTEGWIAGLQLAALSMKGRANTGDFIQSFAGSNRLVLDYLIDEVFEQQSTELQTFLLQTSILDRLTGPLCDAVCFSGSEKRGSSNETASGQEI